MVVLYNICVRNLQDGITSLVNIEPAIRNYISPCCTNLEKELRNLVGSKSVTKPGIFPYVSAHLNINVSTQVFHNEQDVTYTLISDPSQTSKNVYLRILFMKVIV